MFSGPLHSVALLAIGAAGIGFGCGLFSVGTLIAAMAISDAEALDGRTGLALGAWGAVQATCAGLAIALGALARDLVSSAAVAGDLGPTLAMRSTGYAFDFSIEIFMLFAMLIALGPLVRRDDAIISLAGATPFGLREFPI
jgi:BCD family chlorophyll transporter-like MFS transporter